MIARRDAGEAPLWDCIVRTPHWDVVHCDSTSLRGWVVLVLRRHIAALADLTDAEAGAIGPLVQRVSRALHAAVGCEKTYMVQFAESREHRHVHIHVVPRQPDLPEENRGPGVFSLLGVAAEDRVPEADMNDLALQLRAALGAV